MSALDPRIAFFDHHAATWDTYGSPHAEILARLRELRPILNIRPGEDLLEIGCGTGQVTAWVAECVRPGRVTAVDFSPAMLEKARARGVDAELRCADVCADDLGQGRFDLAFCLHSFPHFRDQSAAVRNLARALRPGGRLVILHLDNWRSVNRFHDHVGGPIAGDHLPEPDALRKLLETAGLRVTELIDRDDLFCLTAVRRGDVTESRGPQSSSFASGGANSGFAP
jgi:SAM-dependent methyltransferase